MSQRFSVTKTIVKLISSETEKLGTSFVKTKHLNKKKIQKCFPPTPSTWIIFCLLILSLVLKLLERKQLRNAATLMPCFPLTVISGMLTGKLSSLECLPPIQQHQKLSSSPIALLPCSCIPVSIFMIAQISEERYIVKHQHNNC